MLELSERLGQEGVRLQQLARGAHTRSLVLAEPAEILEEEMELDDAVEDLEPLSFVLGRLLDQVCARLTARALSAAAIRVRFDLGDAFEREEQVRGKNATAMVAGAAGVETEAAAKTYEKALNLPVPMRDSKMLLKLLRLQLQADPPPRRHRENYAGGGPGAATHHAAWIICAQFSGPRKTGVDRGAAGETGGRREYRFAGIGGYPSPGGIPDEQVFFTAE